MKRQFISLMAGIICIGFAVLWLYLSISYTFTLTLLSDFAFSQNAQRIVVERVADAEQLRSCLHNGTILYCDQGARSNLKGVWMTDGAQSSLRVLKGHFMSPDQSRGTDSIAVAGREIEISREDSGAETVQILGEYFRVIGTVGIEDVYSTTDHMIFLPFSRAMGIFGIDSAPEYVLDGDSRSISSTLKAMDDAGLMYTAYSASQEKMSRTYMGAFNSPIPVFVVLLAVVCIIFCIFLIFEVRERRRRMMAVLVSGGTLIQSIYSLIGAPLLHIYVTFFVGEMIAVFVWNAALPVRAAFWCVVTAFVTGALSTAVVVMFAVLSERRTLWSDTQNRVGQDRIHRVLNIVFVCAAAVLLFFTNSLWLIAGDAGKTQDHMLEMSESTFLALTADDTPEEFDAFFMDPTALERIKNLYTDMGSRPGYGFFSCVTQPVEMTNIIDWPVELYDKETHSLFAMQVSSDFFAANQIEVANGRCFAKEDYLAANGGTIPVILGADYAGYFDLGSTIPDVTYLTRNYTLEVAGFLPPGTIDVINMEILDGYILMPALAWAPEPELYSNEWMQQSIIWNQLVSTGVYCLPGPSSVPVVLSWLRSLTAKYGTYRLGALSIPHFTGDILTSLSEQYATLTHVLLIVVWVVLLALLMLISRCIIAVNRNRCHAMKITGASMAQLLGSLSGPVLGMIVAANGIAFLVTLALTGQAAYSVLTLVVTTACVLLTTGPYMCHLLRE